MSIYFATFAMFGLGFNNRMVYDEEVLHSAPANNLRMRECQCTICGGDITARKGCVG